MAKVPTPKSEVVQTTVNPRDQLIKICREQGFVWYAAYDEDLNSECLLEKLISLNKNDVMPLRIHSAILNGYQLCFDKAVCDTPFMRDFEEMSPNSLKSK